MKQDMTVKNMTQNSTREQAQCAPKYVGNILRFFRNAVCLILVMVVGVSDMWGQTDYSGMYYLANNNSDNFLGYGDVNNFYLCPAEVYYDDGAVVKTDNEKPLLTTYKTKQTDEALWIVEKVTAEGYTNYYTFKQKVSENTYKYLTVHDKLTSYDANRMRVHLEQLANNELTDRNYFSITYITEIGEMKGYSIGCVDKYKYNANQYLNPADGNKNQKTPTSDKKNTGGMVGFYTIGTTNTDAKGSVWFFEVPKPIINIDDNYNLTFTCANEDVTIHYTIDGGEPSATGTDDIYTEEIQLTEGVHTIKAIAVMNSGNTGYASGVTTYTVMILGSDRYLIQNLECTDFYMIPGDVSSSNTTVNTSSLFRSTMAWTFSYAGCENGFLYYYIINGSTGDYLYFASQNVYMKTSSAFDDATDKSGYMFSMEQGYSDAEKTNPDGFHIVPKAHISDNTYCIYKGGWSNTTPPTFANSKADGMKGSNNARRPEQRHTRWNIIAYSAPGNVLSSSLVTSDDNNPILFKIENAGTQGQYMNDASTVGTATLGNDALAWYIKEAAYDSERKYYYIVHKTTGKYLKFNQTIASPVTSMGGKNNVLSLLDYDSSASDRYQFVFAKSTVDGAYYIVPKGLEDATYNNYYALYLDAENLTQAIKSNKQRASDSYKWKLVPFCYNPVFVESGGGITLTCATTGAEIHYTDDGTDPDENSTTYSSGWTSSDKVRIKTIAVIKEGSEVVSTSEVVTLLNKPDVTMESGPFVYKGTAITPEVNNVYVSEISAPTSPATYIISYSNNINAGTANITITDLDANDRWYIWNVQTINFPIDKKLLTVTADNKTVEYGSPAPEYTVTITGFENGETRNVLTTIPTATSDYPTGSTVGKTYDIVPSGGVDENYAFTYVNGTLTVAAAFVTLTANSGTETYDGTEKTVTGYTCSVDGLTFTGVSASGSGTNVGNYDVTFSGVTVNATTDSSGDYIVTNIVNGTLTIDPAAATVTADDKAKTYGETDPVLTATVTGMVNGESTGLISYSLNRATGNNVGDYTITPTGEAAQGNYTVSYVPGTFTINQRGLTITAGDCSITYGEAPSNAVTYSGFITGENENTPGVLTGTLVYSYNSQADGQGTSYTTTIPAGTSYIILGGLTSTNYAITYVAGTLTVGKKSIGNGSIASGFTLSFGGGGAIILKDGETTLTKDVDYIVGEDHYTGTNNKYNARTISGERNYEGHVDIRNAIVNFQTDDDEVEWSATFVAENAAGIANNDSDNGHKLPEGVRAYIITAISGEWAIPEPLGYIPEGIPVLLVSDKASGGFLVESASGHTPITTTGDGNQKDANMLEVTATSTHFAARTIYLLSYNEFVHNIAGDLAAGKVYLNPSHSIPSPSRASSRLRIKWEEETGIEDGRWKMEDVGDDAWYTLDGRKVNSKPTQKGMYISNGKKALIR